MGDIRDAFKKAGIIDEKSERQLKHDERVQKKRLGREGLRKARDEKQRKSQQQRQEQREQVRRAQELHDQQREERRVEQDLRADIEARRIRKGLRGPRRFHYRDRDGMLPCLGVDDVVGRRLESGELAIVERTNHSDKIAVVPRELAQALMERHPEAVFHLAGS